jgi:hypothetical protein
MSFERTTTIDTAEDLFQLLSAIPQGYREKMGLEVIADEDVPDHEIQVHAFFLTSPDTNTGYESGFQIASSL